MSWRMILAAILGGVALCGACANDAELLYERELGGGGADVPPPVTGGFTAGSGGFLFPTGSGGEPPPPASCPPPGEPVCECEAFGYCFCEPTPEPGHCSMFCPDGYCGMDCGFSASCDMFCQAGCELICPPSSTCMATCGSDCTVLCPADAYCLVDSIDEPSTILCEEGAICDCVDPGLCSCEGPGCPPPMGP